MAEIFAQDDNATGQIETRRDRVTPGPLDRLAATLDRRDPPFANGDGVPPLGHWLYFLSHDPMSDLAADGHAKRADISAPEENLPRRMWAGSRIAFPGQMRVGQDLVKRSAVTKVQRKEGSSGPLLFVTVRHEIGEADGPPLIVDEHDIVYRSLDAPAAKAAPAAPDPGLWHRIVVPDRVMLFRFSALTFNSHRIHYDRDYAMKDEGYPGLVVHGPLIATLLIDLLRRQVDTAGLADFSFRAVSPLFDGQPISLNGSPPDSDGVVKLWAANAAGGLAMQAQARFAGNTK